MAASKGAVSTLTYAEFEHCAREIVACSDRLRAGWELRSIRPTADPAKTVFLVKKSTLVTQSENKDPVEPLLCVPEDSVEDCGDPATLHVQSTKAGQLALMSVHLEYHVVYSTSYEVPVLYFTAAFQSGKQLPLKDIWSLISDTYVSAESDRWGLITQNEHPLLSRPFYHIHPCHTAQVMAAALSCAGDHEQGTEFSFAGDHEQGTTLSCAGDHKQATTLNSAGDHKQATTLNCDHKQGTALNCAGDHKQATALNCAGDHEQRTALNSAGDHEQRTALNSAGDHEQRTALNCAGDHEQVTALNCAGDHEQATALNCAGDHKQATTLNCAGDHEQRTAAALSRVDFTSRVVSSPPNKPDNFTSNVNYLLTWLSTFGPLVGIKIPSSFSEISKKNLIL